MSLDRPRPARAAIWLLRRVSSHDATDAAVGDILETLDELHAMGRGPRWPNVWLSRQLLSTFAAAMRAATPNCVMKGRSDRLRQGYGESRRNAVKVEDRPLYVH